MFKTIHFDKEDDLFVIPTIVISKIDTKYVKVSTSLYSFKKVAI